MNHRPDQGQRAKPGSRRLRFIIDLEKDTADEVSKIQLGAYNIYTYTLQCSTWHNGKPEY